MTEKYASKHQHLVGRVVHVSQLRAFEQKLDEDCLVTWTHTPDPQKLKVQSVLNTKWIMKQGEDND